MVRVVTAFTLLLSTQEIESEIEPRENTRVLPKQI